MQAGRPADRSATRDRELDRDILALERLHEIEIIGRGCRSEEHTSELQSPDHLVCRLLLEKKKDPQPPQNRRAEADRESPPPRPLPSEYKPPTPDRVRRVDSHNRNHPEHLPHDTHPPPHPT